MERISGIYRIFIKLNNKEYSYVGVSVNINARIRTHFNKIKKNLEHKNDFWEFLEDHNMSVAGAFYQKISSFLIFNKLSFDDIKQEILVVKKFNKVDDIEDEETKLITKFNAILQGFNGIFSKSYKYKFGIKYVAGTPAEKILKAKLLEQETENQKYAELVLKDPQICLPWVSWQIFVVNFDSFVYLSPSKNDIIGILNRWFDFCDLTFNLHFDLKKNLKKIVEEQKKIKALKIETTLLAFGF